MKANVNKLKRKSPQASPAMSAICPKCGHMMDKVLRNAVCERKPQPGDAALCSKCAAILVFTDDLGLRCANAQEFEDLNFDPTIIAAQMTIRAESDWKPDASR